MLFNSFAFLIFLPVVFFLYWFVFDKILRWQNVLLLAASYFFYGWWSWHFLGLLFLSTLLDYSYAFGVASANRRKAKFFLWLSVFNNLGILAAFKYYNFFALQVQEGLEMLGMHADPILLNVALPIGISFYTFHGMSYVFDIYRGQQKPVRNFIDYAVFVCFFPLLVAGPIERANHLLPQVQRRRSFDLEQAAGGIRLMIWGFFKKVVVADNLAPAVNDIFNNSAHESSVSLILGAIYFAFQIYGDFSGYTDIARGVAKLFGFELLFNFNNPYISRSIPEFWKRWHISLSSWFRDYLYIPLGGSRVGKLKGIRNVMIIFLVSGFWHGANWTFIVWGFIHALCFLPSFIMNKNKVNTNETISFDSWRSSITDMLNILKTFIIVTFAWIFFRAENIHQAVEYILHIFTRPLSLGSFISWRSESTEGSHVEFISILLLFLLAALFRSNKLIRYEPAKNAVLIVLILIFGNFVNPADFIYFQF